MTQNFSLLRELLEAEVKPFDAPETGRLEELIEIIKSKCSKAAKSFVDNDYVLYRGWSNHVNNGVYNPSSGIRKSENTTNWYTKFLDTNLMNANFPKRSRSFICTDSASSALDYADGSLTFVFPFDDTQIGVLPKADMWMTGLKRNGRMFTLDYVNFAIGQAQQAFGEEWDTFDDFIDFLESLSPPELEELATTRFGQLGIFDLPPEEQPDAYADFFSKLYSFDDLGAKVTNDVAEIQNFAGSDVHEVWLSGKCVLINVGPDKAAKTALIKDMLK